MTTAELSSQPGPMQIQQASQLAIPSSTDTNLPNSSAAELTLHGDITTTSSNALTVLADIQLLSPSCHSLPPESAKPQSNKNLHLWTSKLQSVTSTASSKPVAHHNVLAARLRSQSSIGSGKPIRKLEQQRSVSAKDQQSTSASLASQMSKLRINRSSKLRRNFETVEDVAEYIRRGHARNIVVMAGAGISTHSGIPDFRSPGTGLYDNLRQYKIPFAEAIFDLDYFRLNPRPFCALARELYPTGRYQPNLVHYFLLLLHQKNLLLRIYTQNIDGLERMCGIPADKLVEAHGSFYSASCIDCHRRHSPDDVKSTILTGRIPLCIKPDCKGFVKPGIVFFGEDLPRRFYKYPTDFSQADLLLVMGTSLQVEPFARIVSAVRFDVPRVLFNNKPVGPFAGRQQGKRINDVTAAGDILEQIRRFVDLLGWTKDLNGLISMCQPHIDPSASATDDSRHVSVLSATTQSSTLHCHSSVLPRSGGGLQKPPAVPQSATTGPGTNTSRRDVLTLPSLSAGSQSNQLLHWQRLRSRPPQTRYKSPSSDSSSSSSDSSQSSTS